MAASTEEFIAAEQRILRFWEETRAFDRLRELRRDAPLFRFVDGPITANNPMGVHHAWGRSLKDALLRYKAMRGYRCRYQNGFDCQGLWVEVEVERALGFNGKPDIEAFGLDAFSRACRERVDRFAGVITQQSIRLGQWMDWSDSYYTHTDANITGIWHFLARCHERGWLHRDALPMPWCPRCGTSLSEHEMAGSYAEVEHLSLFAHVPLREQPDRHLLAWTTTPWTLAANVALAVHPELRYVEVSHDDWSHTLVLAEEARETALRGLDVEVVRTLPGKELVGLAYETFLPDLPAQADVDHRVVAWDQVDAAEGSGIVHIAPGCGREDHELGLARGLAVLKPVDDTGTYLEPYGWLAGRKATDVAEEVAGRLRGTGRLLDARPHRHAFPHCWRCKGELIFRLVDEWFIGTDGVRRELIEAARGVDWKPDFMGKRMEDWLQNMGSWCISRKRYWGLPLPFYVCDACETVTVVESLEALRERATDPAAVDALPELHRPWIDEVRIACSGCGEPVSRVTEVGDCWLDAGIVPFTTLGYFDDPDAWREAFPVEWICEMREQVRLWYYSMLFMGVTIAGRSPYENVLSHERVVAEDGTRFSKTGFMIRFDEAVETIGADAIRYLFCRQPVAQECRFGFGPGQIALRRLSSLQNVATFFTSYAEIDRPADVATLPERTLPLADRWLLARTGHFADQATAAFERWETPGVLREFESWVDDVSNWYVRISRRRFWRDEGGDKDACYPALYRAIEVATRVLAPITPFFAETLWQDLVRRHQPDQVESVHHARWPEPDVAWRDDGLLSRTAVVRDAISQALALRKQAGIRIRQPLPALHVSGPEGDVEALREQEAHLRSELNVKEVVYMDDPGDLETETVGLDFKAAGPVLRGEVGRVKQALESLDAGAAADLARRAREGGEVEVPGAGLSVDASVLVVSRDVRAGFEAGASGALRLWLDTRVDDDLVREGLARDLIRKVQVARRDAGLRIEQHIDLAVETGSPALAAAIDEHAATLRAELLADSLSREIPPGADPVHEDDVRSEPVRFAWKTAGKPGP